MKTSFYFFLWSIVYILIDLTGIPVLINHSFLTACVFVFLIDKICNKVFEPELIYQANLNRALIFEIFYNNNIEKLKKIYRRTIIGQTILAVYCMLTIAGIASIGTHDYFAYAVFGILGILAIVRSCKAFSVYRSIKENGMPLFNESDFSEDNEVFEEYCKYRPNYSAEEMAPEVPKMSKWLNAIALLFAVLCIVGGLYYLLVIVCIGNMNILFSAFVIWSVLAIYYGINDFISSLQSLRGKPTPTLK